MEEQAKLELKKQIIAEQMKEFWRFCQAAMDKYDEDTERVIPESVQEFTEKFMDRLKSIVEVI